MAEKVIDITKTLRDREVERILNMSDDEIMADAIREYGSPANAQKAINRMCDGMNNALKAWGIPEIKFAARTDIEGEE